MFSVRIVLTRNAFAGCFFLLSVFRDVMVGLREVWVGCDSPSTVYPKSLVGKARSEVSNVRFGVVNSTGSTYAVGSVLNKHVVLLMDSPAADIKVSSSVNVALSVTRLMVSAILSPTRHFCTSRVADNSLK